MARTTIEWTDQEGVHGLMELDVVKTRGFERAADVTEFPVETGVAVTDHVRPKNQTVTIEALITNTPLVLPASQMNGVTLGPQTVQVKGPGGALKAVVYRFSSAFDRVKTCDLILDGLVAWSIPVKLTTPLRTIENLAIARYKTDKDQDTGNALPVVLELKQLRVVSTARAPVPAVRRMQTPQTRAQQPTDNRSTLARALDGGAPASAARQQSQAALTSRGGGVGL